MARTALIELLTSGRRRGNSKFDRREHDHPEQEGHVLDADRDRDTTVKRPLLEREEEGESREHDPERAEPSPARAPDGKRGSHGEDGRRDRAERAEHPGDVAGGANDRGVDAVVLLIRYEAGAGRDRRVDGGSG